MITVRLAGGLGNQMFQYAAARCLAIRRGTNVRLDTSVYGSWLSPPREANRPFELSSFRLADPVVLRGAALAAVQARRSAAMYLRRNKLADSPRYYVEQPYKFDSRVPDLPDGSDLTGYFQSEKYFAEVADSIRREFLPRDETLQHSVVARLAAMRRSGRPLVALHIRRGDYLSFKGGTMVQPPDMTRQGIALFPGCDFLVVSDDLAWCRETFTGSEFQFSPFATALEDLLAMAACDHAIVASSTFGWWGAWLIANPAKKIVAPARWFAAWTHVPDMDRDIHPAGWIKI